MLSTLTILLVAAVALLVVAPAALQAARPPQPQQQRRAAGAPTAASSTAPPPAAASTAKPYVYGFSVAADARAFRAYDWSQLAGVGWVKDPALIEWAHSQGAAVELQAQGGVAEAIGSAEARGRWVSSGLGAGGGGVCRARMERNDEQQSLLIDASSRIAAASSQGNRCPHSPPPHTQPNRSSSSCR